MKKNDLTTLLKKVALDEPSANFTAEIMAEVVAQHSHVHSPLLKSLLQQGAHDTPPIDFTPQVMSSVTEVPSPLYKPIITKKGWIAIVGGLVTVFILLNLLESNTQMSSEAPSYFINIGNIINSLVKNTSSISIMTFLSISLLLLVDYFLGTIKANEQNVSR